jgi:hypothetical protein
MNRTNVNWPNAGENMHQPNASWPNVAGQNVFQLKDAEQLIF